MKINEEDYVRTKQGLILKIKSIAGGYVFLDDYNDYYYGNCTEILNIEKSSPKIIDLIEVGDYVNGYQVISIGIDDNKKNVELYVATQGYDELVLEQDIKSIVTREQFGNVEYRVESLV